MNENDDPYVKQLGTSNDIKFTLCEDDSNPDTVGVFRVEANYSKLAARMTIGKKAEGKTINDDDVKKKTADLLFAMESQLELTGYPSIFMGISEPKGPEAKDAKFLTMTITHIGDGHDIHTLADKFKGIIEGIENGIMDVKAPVAQKAAAARENPSPKNPRAVPRISKKTATGIALAGLSPRN